MTTVQKLATPAVEATVTAPARRLMRVTKAASTDELERLLQLIATNTEQIETLAAANEQYERKLRELLEERHMSGYTDGTWEANLVNKMSKASRVPDPVKVAKALGDQFLSVVKVSVTDLKEHMTDREIDELSTTTPATVIGTELKVGRVKRKVKKG